ncbi:MAG: MazG nucleotide pyrophosphohydrolase domain-containing protein [Candidatus Hodarchaeales archaeon]|jgi:NTP pyrophosphatase (non-canonical NTP hydrolase)
MELNGLIKQVNDFIQDHGGYWDIPWLLAAITEELGELSRALQKYSGIRVNMPSLFQKSAKYAVEEESGDLLFALICLTNFLEINLEKALIKTLNKYSSRGKTFSKQNT